MNPPVPIISSGKEIIRQGPGGCQDGTTRYTTDVVAERITFLGSKGDSTNTNYEERSFKAIISTKNSLTGIKKYNSSVIPEFIFGRIKRQDMSNFYNVYRIREELPFMERDNIKINIAIGDDINFKK